MSAAPENLYHCCHSVFQSAGLGHLDHISTLETCACCCKGWSWGGGRVHYAHLYSRILSLSPTAVLPSGNGGATCWITLPMPDSHSAEAMSWSLICALKLSRSDSNAESKNIWDESPQQSLGRRAITAANAVQSFHHSHAVPLAGLPPGGRVLIIPNPSANATHSAHSSRDITPATVKSWYLGGVAIVLPSLNGPFPPPCCAAIDTLRSFGDTPGALAARASPMPLRLLFACDFFPGMLPLSPSHATSAGPKCRPLTAATVARDSTRGSSGSPIGADSNIASAAGSAAQPAS